MPGYRSGVNDGYKWRTDRNLNDDKETMKLTKSIRVDARGQALTVEILFSELSEREE